MTNDAERHRGYCSPKRAGEHTVELQLNETVASISLNFDATGFGEAAPAPTLCRQSSSTSMKTATAPTMATAT